MKKIRRYIQSAIENALIPGKAVILLGARRVGKTTILKDIIADKDQQHIVFYNCDDPDIRSRFENIGLNALKRLFASSDTIIFDEAQRIKNIGLILKMIVDEMPEKRLLTSGSSSFELSNSINEPLTGRKTTFTLYPLSVLELHEHEHHDSIATTSYRNDMLRFGSYPDLFALSDPAEKESYLLELASDYLYKDALEYQDIRNPEQLRKLLIALALQIGQEVSYTELGQLSGLDQKTVVRYCDLLEKSFVIFRLPALGRNPRTEIAKSRKIYFYDIGIRNALIKNFNPYDLRGDRGEAWECFIVSERMKKDIYTSQRKNYYFWRTYAQKEIDLIEEYQGTLSGFEIKWSPTAIAAKAAFLKSYPHSNIHLIHQDNFLDFVT